MEEREAARTEALAAQAAYRKRVRAAGLAIVFGVSAVLGISAVLPTTPPADRVSLLFVGALATLGGLIWFTLVPKSAFGEARFCVSREPSGCPALPGGSESPAPELVERQDASNCSCRLNIVACSSGSA